MPQCRQLPPDRNEGILHGITSIGLVAQDGSGGTDHRAKPRVRDRGERVDLAEPGPTNERRVHSPPIATCYFI
ncbi:MAG: hypothetical protein M3067_15215 [Chloroflexota bacterium]|nr:hypothetical protein [Chloroflexota bacterium]